MLLSQLFQSFLGDRQHAASAAGAVIQKVGSRLIFVALIINWKLYNLALCGFDF